MGGFRIRGYQPGDLDACRSLWGELVEQHRRIYDDPSIGGETPGLHFDEHLARVGSERVWVAECDARVVGLTGLAVAEDGADVEPVCVASSYRGRGIGRALVEQAVGEARRLGVRWVSVRPVARNEEALDFFFRCGFGILGQLELVMDLSDRACGYWRPGPSLAGHRFLS